MRHKTKIHPIPLGFDQAYVLEGAGTIMVDGGLPGKSRAFLNAIQAASISPQAIQLLILTHGHVDHIGSARAIKEITGARIVMHKQDAACLENSLKVLPPGVTPWGKILIRIMGMLAPLIKTPSAAVDIVLADEAFTLGDYGIDGRVISTPGHSPGSLSVLLDSGEAFVGDLAMNALPLRLRPGFPIFAEDMQKVIESWERILDAGAQTIYPAHGQPFPAGEIRRILSKTRPGSNSQPLGGK